MYLVFYLYEILVDVTAIFCGIFEQKLGKTKCHTRAQLYQVLSAIVLTRLLSKLIEAHIPILVETFAKACKILAIRSRARIQLHQPIGDQGVLGWHFFWFGAVVLAIVESRWQGKGWMVWVRAYHKLVLWVGKGTRVIRKDVGIVRHSGGGDRK